MLLEESQIGFMREKAKMEKIRPKLGKIDIDYQKLHNALIFL